MIDELGNLRIKQTPVKPSVLEKGEGKIVDPPNPRDARIAKETKKDFTLDGRLKKHKKRAGENEMKNIGDEFDRLTERNYHD